MSREVSGADLADLLIEADPLAVASLSALVARRAAIRRYRSDGMTWGQARRAAVTAEASPTVQAVVRAALARGATNRQAIAEALVVA